MPNVRVNKQAPIMVETTDADITQLITVTTAGTPVQGPDKSNISGWMIKADPTNVGNVWFMFHGQTKAAKGFPVAVGEAAPLYTQNLSSIDFDADTNGNKIRALKV